MESLDQIGGGRASRLAPRRASARTARTVYPYSIVPGGVYNAEEAKKAVARDPVVAEHFRDFALDVMHV